MYDISSYVLLAAQLVWKEGVGLVDSVEYDKLGAGRNPKL
jgi:hypothetical protein